MSRIERLRIQGIRSFGPEEKDGAQIKFFSPLTLILGQNGCGKTTIIEALKYATCGELPTGTELGRGFLHDPKLANVTEVKGCVRLKIRDIKGNASTILRIAKVTQKYKKVEFQTLDTTFTPGEGKDKQGSLSSRCSNINEVTCQALGVSQAVLTNVIFCHQEDSLWPLEKGQKIKERFDAIFGITEYNKCLDHFRALSKDMDSKKGLLKKDVDCSSKFWEESKEKRKNLEDLKTKFGANQDNIALVQTQMEPILDQIKEIIGKELNFANHMSKVTDKKNRRQLILETINETKKEIQTEFVGSKDSLMLEIQTFEKKLEETNSRMTDLIADRDDIKTEEARLQKEIDAKTMLMGQLQRDEDQNKEKVEMRNMRLKNLASELKLAGMTNSQINETNGDEMLRSIEKKIKECTDDLKQIQDTQRNTEKSIQNKIDNAREKKATLNQDIKMKQKSIEDNKREIEKIKAEIAEVDKSGEKLATLENDLKKVNEQLNEIVKSLNADECKQEIEDAQKNIKNMEEKLSALDKEIKSLLQISMERSNLDKLHERKKKLEKELDALKDKHRSSFQHLLSSMPESDFKSKIQRHIEKMTNEIRSLDAAINNSERELSVLTEKKRNLEEQIRQKTRKVSQDEDKIEECCGKSDVKQYYENMSAKLQESHDMKGTLSASKFMFGKYVEKLNAEEPICPLCRREFKNKQEIEDVIEDLTRRLKEIPARLTDAESEIKKYSECQHKAAVLLPLHESIVKARTEEIPKLRTQVNEINSKIEAAQAELESNQTNLMGPQTDKEMAANLLSDAIQMDQHLRDIRGLENDIRNLESKLPSCASKRTLQEANDEQDKLKSDLSNLRKKLDIEQRQLSAFNEKVNKLRERKTDLTAQQLKIVGGVQQRKSLTEKLDELTMLADVYEQELQTAQSQLRPVADELDENNRNLCQLRAKHEKLLEEKRKTVNEYEKRVDEIKILQSAIHEYDRKGGSKRLANTKEELAQKRLNKETLERRKSDLEKDIESSKQFQNTHMLKKHNLDANLKLRNKKEELAKVEEEINELEGHMEILNYDELRVQKAQLEKKKKNLEEQKIFAEGRQKELNLRIKDIERELSNTHYKNAEEEYRKNVVKLTVATKAIEDLKMYEKAMDWAMIHFHKERMKMINEIVRELWRSIYRGNDVDYVEVKTDESSSTASGRRSYNYKVVQVKNGIELDMAGRCSAGQKVLAALIIRMALAETFSKNCGILALDEPTTNLDRDNVESLSNALAEIVEKRSAQRNFQLLVITHDEDFLKKLFRVEKVEHYLEVKRDNRGRSQVYLRDV